MRPALAWALVATLVWLGVPSVSAQQLGESEESRDQPALAAAFSLRSVGGLLASAEARERTPLDPSPAFWLLPRSPDRSEAGAGAGVVVLLADADSISAESSEPSRALGRDWAGLARDTALLVGYEMVVAVPLYLATDGSGRGQPRALGESWWDNVRNPQWDSDALWINYVGHPYVGATYYIRARERGFGRVGSFLHTVLLSTLFEFGVEAFFEPPSYQDLIVTPVAGALIGAFVFEPLRTWIKAKPERAWHDYAILVATDPIGALNGVVEWLLGVNPNARLQLRPLAGALAERTARPRPLSSKPEGLRRPTNGVQLEVTVRY